MGSRCSVGNLVEGVDCKNSFLKTHSWKALSHNMTVSKQFRSSIYNSLDSKPTFIEKIVKAIHFEIGHIELFLKANQEIVSKKSLDVPFLVKGVSHRKIFKKLEPEASSNESARIPKVFLSSQTDKVHDGDLPTSHPTKLMFPKINLSNLIGIQTEIDVPCIRLALQTLSVLVKHSISEDKYGQIQRAVLPIVTSLLKLQEMLQNSTPLTNIHELRYEVDLCCNLLLNYFSEFVDDLHLPSDLYEKIQIISKLQ